MSDFLLSFWSEKDYTLEQELRILQKVIEFYLGQLPNMTIEFLKKRRTREVIKVFQVRYNHLGLGAENFAILQDIYKLEKLRTRSFNINLFVE